MAELSDEMLMAYADGALDATARAAVDAQLANNPEYRRKVEIFRATLGPLRDAFAGAGPDGSAQRLADRIRRERLRPARDWARLRLSNVLAGPSMRPPFVQAGIPAAIAASVVLIAGIGIGWLLRPSPSVLPAPAAEFVSFSDGALLARGALAEVLETRRSAPLREADPDEARDWRIAASFTFKSSAGSLCRRYQMAHGSADSFAGYACRSPDGAWLVHAHARLSPAPSGTSGSVPAAGGSDPALDAAISAAMDGDVLQTDEEARLIARRWEAGGR